MKRVEVVVVAYRWVRRGSKHEGRVEFRLGLQRDGEGRRKLSVVSFDPQHVTAEYFMGHLMETFFLRKQQNLLVCFREQNCLTLFLLRSKYKPHDIIIKIIMYVGMYKYVWILSIAVVSRRKMYKNDECMHGRKKDEDQVKKEKRRIYYFSFLILLHK